MNFRIRPWRTRLKTAAFFFGLVLPPASDIVAGFHLSSGAIMPSQRPSLRHADLPYRPCVGVMLFNQNGDVFVGKRIDQVVEGWQLPQGGIDEGETPVEAAFRELEEEIGTRNAVFLREHEDWLAYDLPGRLLGIALRGRYRGQRQKWLAMRFVGKDSDISVRTAEPEFSEWRWLDIKTLPRLVVPFKRDTYAKVIAAFRDLAQPV